MMIANLSPNMGLSILKKLQLELFLTTEAFFRTSNFI